MGEKFTILTKFLKPILILLECVIHVTLLQNCVTFLTRFIVIFVV